MRIAVVQSRLTMSDVRKKAKKEKKAKARKEKARLARVRHVEERKAEKERDDGAPRFEREESKGDRKVASNKSAGPSISRVHRTQGK